MNRRNWLKALAGGVAALCGLSAAKAAAAKCSPPPNWLRLEGRSCTFRNGQWVAVPIVTWVGLPPSCNFVVTTLPAELLPEAP